MSELLAIQSDPVAATHIFKDYHGRFRESPPVLAGIFLCTVGSLAGFAAQQAVWKTCIEPEDRNPGDFLVRFSTTNGETFYSGEATNLFLQVAKRPWLSFFSFVAGAVPNAEPATLPNLREICDHVARSAGGPEFWNVRGADATFPSPRMVLNNRDWSETERILTQYGTAPFQWPVVLGFVAQRTIRALKNVVPPNVAVRLVMEAAVIASKADPRTVPGATSGVDPRLAPQQWSDRALRPDRQQEVIDEMHGLLPREIPL